MVLSKTPRAWFHRCREFLTSQGFISSKFDFSLFIKTYHGDYIYLFVYVDDIIVTRTSSKQIQSLIQSLHVIFTMKDLGSLSYFLGSQATKRDLTLHLSQSQHISDLLHEVKMSDSKPVTTPMHEWSSTI
jgi:Reverse transcriptase (RNA-dependent DNA polymerase)